MIIFDQNNHHNLKQWKLTKSNSQNCRQHARTAAASLLFFLDNVVPFFLQYNSGMFQKYIGPRQCAHLVLCEMFDRSNTFMIERLAHSKSHRFHLPFSFHYFENRFHLTRILNICYFSFSHNRCTHTLHLFLSILREPHIVLFLQTIQPNMNNFEKKYNFPIKRVCVLFF